MNYKLFILGLLFTISLKGFSVNKNDTIYATIDLRQVDSLGLSINIGVPPDLNGIISYQFPKSIPGIYEYLNKIEPIIKLSYNKENVKCYENSFRINSNLFSNVITYSAKNTINKFQGIFAEDTYFLKDSIYILNWHYLLGFFQNNTKRPYKIKIIKSAKLLGTGSLLQNKIIEVLT